MDAVLCRSAGLPDGVISEQRPELGSEPPVPVWGRTQAEEWQEQRHGG